MTKQQKSAPTSPPSSGGWHLVPEPHKEGLDLERFVAALLAFTLKRMEKESAERELESRKQNPPKEAKTRDYVVLTRPSDGQVAAFVPEVDGILVIEASEKEALEKIVVAIMAEYGLARITGSSIKASKVPDKIRAESTERIVTVPVQD